MTMTRAEKMRKKMEAEVARAEREDSVQASLPQGYPWHIYAQKREAWAKLEPKYLPNGSQDYAPTLDDVVALASALPPVPLVLYRDGCTSIQPWDYPAPRGAGEPLRMEPFVIDVEGAASYQRENATIRWWSRVNGERVRISIMFRSADHKGLFGRVVQDYASGRREHETSNTITSASYTMPPGLSGGICVVKPDEIGHRRALALAERIGWARCGGPGKYTVYFSPLGDGGATLADLVHNLREGVSGE